MGHLFRSEEMDLMELIVQAEAAYDTVSELGEIGVCQFNDLNKNVSMFQRQFAPEVRRCDEMERHLRFFAQQIEKTHIVIPESVADREWGVRPTPQDLDLLETKCRELDEEIHEINSNEETLQRNFLELSEMKEILRKTADFFNEAQHFAFSEHQSTPAQFAGTGDNYHLLAEDVEAQHQSSSAVKLGFLTGVIRRDKVVTFERVLWRATRGNAFLRRADIEEDMKDPTTGDSVPKSVFLIFFQGDQLELKARKISEGFGATVYPCPESSQQRRDLGIQVQSRLNELQSVLDRTLDHRKRVLGTVARQLDAWTVKVKKIKAIYHTLNFFSYDVTRKCMVANMWIPRLEIVQVQQALRDATDKAETGVNSILTRKSTKKKPPTFNRTNKFTEGFQTIVDAYGVASYREVNPALFTIITFPFLFAVMFGDIGHGILMALMAGFLVLREKQLAKLNAGEIFDMLFGGRYIILLMGIFSIYTGFIYNDMFSKSLNLFGSSWPSIPPNVDTETINFIPEQYYNYSGGNPYPFGIDPYWALAENKLTFLNSFKMKTSVILGVTHMMFGVVMGIFNHIYFKNTLSIYFEFIPQVLFLGAIFGYLVFLIFLKWSNNWVLTARVAPSLLITLIDMFLKIGKVPQDNRSYAFDTTMQGTIQSLLVLLAVFCVPWMLLVKPLILNSRHKKQLAANSNTRTRTVSRSNGGDTTHLLLGEDDDEVGMSEPARPVQLSEFKHTTSVEGQEVALDTSHGGEGGGHGHGHGDDDEEEEEFSFGEIFVHQCIHTIEYCLGCISNTASYLRLWALSLAHAELSEVLWHMVLAAGLKGNVILLFLAWGFWAVLTVAVLLIMEGLSAFLHALRLHWVEFQNKFYQGAGVKFKPFSFAVLLRGKIEDE